MLPHVGFRSSRKISPALKRHNGVAPVRVTKRSRLMQ